MGVKEGVVDGADAARLGSMDGTSVGVPDPSNMATKDGRFSTGEPTGLGAAAADPESESIIIVSFRVMEGVVVGIATSLRGAKDGASVGSDAANKDGRRSTGDPTGLGAASFDPESIIIVSFGVMEGVRDGARISGPCGVSMLSLDLPDGPRTEGGSFSTGDDTGLGAATGGESFIIFFVVVDGIIDGAAMMMSPDGASLMSLTDGELEGAATVMVLPPRTTVTVMRIPCSQ